MLGKQDLGGDCTDIFLESFSCLNWECLVIAYVFVTSDHVSPCPDSAVLLDRRHHVLVLQNLLIDTRQER